VDVPDKEEVEDGSGHGSEEVKEPSMYRWASTVREKEGKKEMVIGFSVPLAVLPQPSEVCDLRRLFPSTFSVLKVMLQRFF
jgi:hypothetical protein